VFEVGDPLVVGAGEVVDPVGGVASAWSPIAASMANARISSTSSASESAIAGTPANQTVSKS